MQTMSQCRECADGKWMKEVGVEECLCSLWTVWTGRAGPEATAWGRCLLQWTMVRGK